MCWACVKLWECRDEHAKELTAYLQGTNIQSYGKVMKRLLKVTGNVGAKRER